MRWNTTYERWAVSYQLSSSFESPQQQKLTDVHWSCLQLPAYTYLPFISSRLWLFGSFAVISTLIFVAMTSAYIVQRRKFTRMKSYFSLGWLGRSLPRSVVLLYPPDLHKVPKEICQPWCRWRSHWLCEHTGKQQVYPQPNKKKSLLTALTLRQKLRLCC